MYNMHTGDFFINKCSVNLDLSRFIVLYMRYDSTIQKMCSENMFDSIFTVGGKKDVEYRRKYEK